MRLREAFLFQINREICRNSSTIIKPFKDEALIVPNFRQMLFLVSCLMSRRKIATVASKCLPLTLLSARNTSWLEMSHEFLLDLIPPDSLTKNATFLFGNSSGQGHGLLRQYLYWEHWGWMLVTLNRVNNHRKAPDSGSGRTCWPTGQFASASSVSRIKSINIKLAYWQTNSLRMFTCYVN